MKYRKEKARFPEWVNEMYDNLNKEIKEVMDENGENWGDVIYGSNITKEECAKGSKYLEVPYFNTIWTKNYVYFRLDNEGGLIASAPRNPPEE